ncbi:phosphotransferase family protein [Sodalinema gerasimenkoae]|uniref:phosphotransferase family protein n=1 Tax=Sodalinema gerasimenkoae TaxID=2862348 RepID=UPI00135B90DD|nr:phosphotransferase [Sodalinema gerasimenkoae]
MSNYAYSQSDDLISALPALEAKLMKKSCSKPRPFLDVEGAYWVAGDLKLIPKIMLGRIPTGSRKQQLLNILQYSLFRRPNYRKINSQAELIFVKSESHKMRVFYPDFILKVVREERDIKTPWFAKEIEGREAMRASLRGEIRIPKVVAAGKEKGLYYLLEERLNCHPINKENADERQKIQQELLPVLMDWYEPVRSDPMARIFGEQPEALVEEALTSSVLAEMEPETVQVFHDVAAQIDDYNLEVPVAMAHGDINLLNICVTTRGKLVLVDWEKWGKHPVMKELACLACSFGIGKTTHRRIRQAYNQRFADLGSSFDEQVLVYYFLKCSKKLVEASQIQDSQSSQNYPRSKTAKITRHQKYVLQKLKVCQKLFEEINQHHSSATHHQHELPLL